MGSRWRVLSGKLVTAVFLSHHGRSSDKVCGYRLCVLSGKSVIPMNLVWRPSTVVYPLVDVLHFLHWDQSFIGSNFHWDRIHWDQDFSEIECPWERNSTGSNFAGSKRQWGSGVALTPCYLFCPSGWQPQVQLPRDICLHLASTVRTPTRRNQRLQIAPQHFQRSLNALIGFVHIPTQSKSEIGYCRLHRARSDSGIRDGRLHAVLIRPPMLFPTSWISVS